MANRGPYRIYSAATKWISFQFSPTFKRNFFFLTDHNRAPAYPVFEVIHEIADMRSLESFAVSTVETKLKI